MRKKMATRTFAFALTFGVSVSALSATIEGTIVFEGRPPPMPLMTMGTDPACEQKHPKPVRSESIVLGEGQALANVLVQIRSGLADKEYTVPSEPIIITQAGCIYAPHVFGVRPGQPIKFLNPDGMMHNVNAKPEVNRGFNISMPAFRDSATRTFSKAEPVFPINCDAHKWMGMWCAVIDHPYFDVTDKDGKFSIKNLEAGTYEIEVWHERLGTQTTTLNVSTEEIKKLEFTFSRRTNRSKTPQSPAENTGLKSHRSVK